MREEGWLSGGPWQADRMSLKAAFQQRTLFYCYYYSLWFTACAYKPLGMIVRLGINKSIWFLFNSWLPTRLNKHGDKKEDPRKQSVPKFTLGHRRLWEEQHSSQKRSWSETGRFRWSWELKTHQRQRSLSLDPRNPEVWGRITKEQVTQSRLTSVHLPWL